MVAKREVYSYSSNVVRDLKSSSDDSNRADIDNNLDNLLEDLQSSIPQSRYAPTPSSEVRSSGKVSLTAGDEITSGKVSSYEYHSSYGNSSRSGTMNNEAKQLDELLTDLKSETMPKQGRNVQLYSVTSSSNYGGTGAGTGGNDSRTRNMLYQTESSKINRDLDDFSSQPSGYLNKKETVSSKNVQSYSSLKKDKSIVPFMEIIEPGTSQLSEDEMKMSVSEDILPIARTKVVKTVRTYTYEIPSELNATTSEKTSLLSNNDYRSDATLHDRGPKVVSYNRNQQEIVSERNERNVYPSSTTKTTVINRGQHNERDIYPLSSQREPGDVYPSSSTTTTTTIINKGQRSDRDIYPPPNQRHERDPYPLTSTTTTTINKETDLHRQPPYPSSGHPPTYVYQFTPTKTTYYKNESVNKYNTNYGPPDDHPPHTMTSIHDYSSSNTNTMNGYPKDREFPHPQPTGFPVDDTIDSIIDSSTMNVNYSDTYKEHPVKREVATSVAVKNPEAPEDKAIVYSKNKAGPPVYYPAGQELFARKEQSMGAYRAEGGYSKASGKYEYEAESKSKSKSRSGAAVVPVCLPLCCAMPCSIM